MESVIKPYVGSECASFLIIILSCAAGYNHFEVAEHLLENGADVNAQDKGGLIPLHNASSYGVSSWSGWFCLVFHVLITGNQLVLIDLVS